VELDKGITHIPRLTQPNQRTINRAVTMRMATAHGVTNGLGALDELLIIHITLVKHIPEDTSGNRF
jgi:hypothetical protein